MLYEGSAWVALFDCSAISFRWWLCENCLNNGVIFC